MRRVRSGAVKAGGDVRGTALIEDGAGIGASLRRADPDRRLPDGARRRVPPAAGATTRGSEVRGPARAAVSGRRGSTPKKLILTVIDGLGPELLDRRSPRASRRPSTGSRARAVAPTRACRPSRRSPRCACRRSSPASTRPGSHDPQHELVPPRRAADGRVRLVALGHARDRHPPAGRRPAREPQHAAPVAAHRRRCSRRWTTRGFATAAVNTYVIRGRTRHPITRPVGPPAGPPDGRRRCGVRAPAVLPGRPVLLRPDRRAAQHRRRRRPPQRPRRPLARDPRRLRLPVLLPVRDRCRPAPRRGRDGGGGRCRPRPRAAGGGRRWP